MSILRAFTYSFDDPHWLKKLGEMTLFTLLCFTPIIGIIPLCALLGYLTEIIHNVMNDYPRPLPEWDHIGEDVGKGAQVLLAMVVYALPPLLVLLLLNTLRGSLGESLFSQLASLGLLGLLPPLFFLYALLAGAVFAVGFARYADTWEKDEFFRIGDNLDCLRANPALTLQWLVASIAANIVLLLLLPLALLGLIFSIPAHGYLIGAFGQRLRNAKRLVRAKA